MITDLGISIGRDRDNELVIEDGYVSREHAEAIFEDGRCILRDSESLHGTIVNGQKITGSVTLRPGDVITVGCADIHVEATHTYDNRQQEWKLTVLSGPDDGSEFNVIAGTTTIGRSPQNDIVLNSKQVSRAHARFINTSGSLRIEDRQSTNGTFVNDTRVTLQGLENGDHIQLGDTRMQISMM
jgi:pSer/pThr/pTyr-binding forkhead associated (FHA) protein